MQELLTIFKFWCTFTNCFLLLWDNRLNRSEKTTGWHIKKWTISFCCFQRVYDTHIEDFCNISTAPETLIKMFVLCCNNWSFWNCLIARSIKSVRCKHVYLWHHDWCPKEYLTWIVLQRIFIRYCLRIKPLASTFYKHRTTVEQQFA